MCDVSGLPPRAVFARLRDAGLGSTPGHRGGGARTTACASGSPRTSCRSRAGSRSSRPRTPRGLRSTVTVMFGHIEEPWELAEHMRVVRELQERTGGFTEFVPLSFIPFHTLLGRTHGVEEISRRRTSSTRPRSGSRSADGPQSAGELGEDGSRRRHRVAALGSQRPRRDADGGVDLADGGQLPRRQARARGPDRRRPSRRPSGGRAHHAVRDPPPLRAPAA